MSNQNYHTHTQVVGQITFQSHNSLLISKVNYILMCFSFPNIFNYLKIISIVYISSCNVCLYWKQKGYERVALKVLSIREMN